MPELNGGGCAVGWSVTAGANRSPDLSTTPAKKVAHPVTDALGTGAPLVEVDARVTVTVRAEVDLAMAGALLEALQEAAAPGATLVVDLSAAPFMGSSGRDELLRTRGYLATIGSPIVLRSQQNRVLKLLEVSGLGPVFPVERGPKPNGHDLAEPGVRERQWPG